MKLARLVIKWFSILLLCSFFLLLLAGRVLKPVFFDVRGEQATLYKPDTMGYLLNQVAARLGVDAPVFIFDSADPNRYRDDLNALGKQTAGALGASWSAVVVAEKSRKRQEALQKAEVMAYSTRIDNTNACALVFTEHLEDQKPLYKSSVVLHELTHCGQQYLKTTHADRQKKIEDEAASIGKGLPYNVIDTVYAESLPTAMQRALSFTENGLASAAQFGFGYEYDDAKKDKRWVEAPNVALVLPEICAKAGDCPVDLLQLQEKLIQDPRFRGALRSDMERWAALKSATKKVAALAQ